MRVQASTVTSARRRITFRGRGCDGSASPGWRPDEVDALLGQAERDCHRRRAAGSGYPGPLEMVHGRYLPNKVLVVAGPDQVGTLSQRIPLLAGRTQIDGSATAYVCENYTCGLPVTDPKALLKLLE